jgi:hypothetical protein
MFIGPIILLIVVPALQTYFLRRATGAALVQEQDFAPT